MTASTIPVTLVRGDDEVVLRDAVRLLVDESGTSPGWPLAVRGGAVRVQEGVRVVIGRRLDRLSRECCEVLRLAALVGEFDMEQLDALTDAGPGGLDDVLDEALDAHVLEEVPEAPDRFRFTHRLVQETLITELSTTKRVRAHARIAQALEEHYADGVDAHASERVRHFAEAETVLGAAGFVRYSRSAGEQALVAHAYDEAREHFRRALDAKEGQPMDDETALLLFGLARSELAVRERYDLEEPLGHLKRAFSHFADAWEGYTVEVEELTAAGENQVVASANYHAIGKESGAPVETSVSHVYDFAAGRIVRWRMFNSRAEALEAVGLSE